MDEKPKTALYEKLHPRTKSPLAKVSEAFMRALRSPLPTSGNYTILEEAAYMGETTKKDR